MRGARAGRWLRGADATALALARFTELVQPGLNCGFQEGALTLVATHGERMSVLDAASPQRGSICWTFVKTSGLGRGQGCPTHPCAHTPDSLGLLAITSGELASRTQGGQ